jgi:MoxR-like ATPase
LRIVVENAKKFQNIGQQTVLFVDEIHRFNKAQQDAFLPHIESGLITVYCQSPASMGAYHATDVTAQRTHLIFVALNSQPKVLIKIS